MSNRIVWLSLDPIRKKIDFYPKAIAMRIEAKYENREPLQQDQCVLGHDFYNATIHFHHSGLLYQTTPGMSMGRAGFKQSGYRSVKRVIVPPDNKISIYGRQVRGEWRIAPDEYLAEHTFNEAVPENNIITLSGSISSLLVNMEISTIQPWTADDLEKLKQFDDISGEEMVEHQTEYNEIANKSVIIWQWCLGVPERQGNLMRLGDEWWSPYFHDINQTIETSFTRGKELVTISIPVIGEKVIVLSNRQEMYATQRDPVRHTIRIVRRVIKTVKDVKEMFDKIGKPPVTLNIEYLIERALKNGMEIPHEFYCSITQDIMNDPVKTCDDHTYDRFAIERWFNHNTTSPLTGLRLHTTVLTPNTELKTAIDEYFDKVKNEDEDEATMEQT